jgi:hypothetical protein
MLHLEADDGALLAAELDADQVDGLAAGAVLVSIAAVLDLLQGPTLGGPLDDLEL